MMMLSFAESAADDILSVFPSFPRHGIIQLLLFYNRTMIQKRHDDGGAEDRFIDLFCETGGAEENNPYQHLR